MKQLSKSSEKEFQKPESKEVKIRVIFQDEDRGFKDLYLELDEAIEVLEINLDRADDFINEMTTNMN